MDGPRAWDLELAFDVTISDLERSFHLTLRNGVLVYVEKDPNGNDPHLTLAKQRLLQLAAGDRDSAGIEVTGGLDVIDRLLGVLSPGDDSFEIVLP